MSLKSIQLTPTPEFSKFQKISSKFFSNSRLIYMGETQPRANPTPSLEVSPKGISFSPWLEMAEFISTDLSRHWFSNKVIPVLLRDGSQPGRPPNTSGAKRSFKR